MSLYETVGKAADIGTMGHWLVEQHIDGAATDLKTLLGHFPGATDEMHNTAKDAFGAYLTWERHTKLKVIDQEMLMVSEEFRFGGTPDAIGEIDGELCLVDWKTSNAVYLDHLIQLAAYRHLWDVNNPERPLTGGSHLCRFAKTHGDFAHHYYPNLDDAWEAFKLMRRLYDITASLKKRAA